ncbi:MAG: feruloyl-CoA synthase [Saprospiraceae bacterium]
MAPFLKIPTQQIDIRKREEDGVIYLKSTLQVAEHPFRMTERLLRWADEKADSVFLGQRDENADWQIITYRETLQQVRAIAQWLIQQEASADRPVAIIAENGIRHALLALAALHIGVPYTTINPAYITKSTDDYQKLRFTLDQLTPGVIAGDNGPAFTAAITAIAPDSKIVWLQPPPIYLPDHFAFEEVIRTTPTSEVDDAFERIQPDTIAKVLFTSGSTGQPKGVINTHQNITTNWQQITQVFPFMTEGFELIDWLPWNHTFGGNHNLGLTLYHGGSLYIDEGKPTPEGIRTTIMNLRERQPDIYFNVPKGFEELIPYLRSDQELRDHFFSRLKLLFYAGAGMGQHIWNALEELAYISTGKRLLISTGLGCTESSPSAMFNTVFGSFPSMLGVPVPGLELKLVPVSGKLEARYQGGNVMPGYWRNPEATAKAFDEEGYYKTGDALKFVDSSDPNAGMIFDGRIAEDFKLSTGTWVNVGNLRTHFIASGKGLIQDVVITGHNQDYVGAIVFPDPNHLNTHFGLSGATSADLNHHPVLRKVLQELINEFAGESTGSSNLIRKILIAPFALSPEKGELTDKGSINQRAVLTNRAEYVEWLYDKDGNENVIEINNK